MKNIANVSYIKNAVNIKLISDKVNPIFIFEALYSLRIQPRQAATMEANALF